MHPSHEQFQTCRPNRQKTPKESKNRSTNKYIFEFRWLLNRYYQFGCILHVFRPLRPHQRYLLPKWERSETHPTSTTTKTQMKGSRGSIKDQRDCQRHEMKAAIHLCIWRELILHWTQKQVLWKMSVPLFNSNASHL